MLTVERVVTRRFKAEIRVPLPEGVAWDEVDQNWLYEQSGIVLGKVLAKAGFDPQEVECSQVGWNVYKQVDNAYHLEFEGEQEVSCETEE